MRLSRMVKRGSQSGDLVRSAGKSDAITDGVQEGKKHPSGLDKA